MDHLGKILKIVNEQIQGADKRFRIEFPVNL